LRRSTRKNENKAKKQRSESKKHKPKREVPAGFRKLVVDGAAYGWRTYGERVEIRVPGTIKLKWLVPVWQLQGFTSQNAWEDEHKDCCRDKYCCGGCTEYLVGPGVVRKYIDEMRKATC
jgi:hypothetical protein